VSDLRRPYRCLSARARRRPGFAEDSSQRTEVFAERRITSAIHAATCARSVGVPAASAATTRASAGCSRTTRISARGSRHATRPGTQGTTTCACTGARMRGNPVSDAIAVARPMKVRSTDRVVTEPGSPVWNHVYPCGHLAESLQRRQRWSRRQILGKAPCGCRCGAKRGTARHSVALQCTEASESTRWRGIFAKATDSNPRAQPNI
jgi:hypothetical protein